MSTTVCFCNVVSEDEIRAYLKKFPNATFKEVQKNTGASSSCGRCALSVKKTIERLKEDLPSDDQLSLF